MLNTAQILVVDDEEAIRFFLSEELRNAGYQALEAGSGEECLLLLKEHEIDLVILDLRMGGMDGLQVMGEIAKLPQPPAVIMLTAHSSLDSAVSLLRSGGDDYLSKPCRSEDLLASVQRCLKKRHESTQRQQLIEMIASAAQKLQGEPAAMPLLAPVEARVPALQARGLTLDREKESVLRAGRLVPLTPTEFKLLACLMENIDRPVSCRELVSAIHGLPELDFDEREARQSISTHIWRLRHKLGNAPDNAPYVMNVRGRAYKFVSGWENKDQE